MTVWDETTRPTGPALDPTRVYAPHELETGQHMVQVHDHLRGELDQLRELVGQVIAGRLDPAVARSDINAMTMRQNDWTMGAYCAQYCRVVTTHHTIESSSMFPHLKRADPALGAVIDRLEAEHRVIHDVLEGVDRGLVAYMSDSGDAGSAALRSALDVLTDSLLSHLAYEERELVEPLARLGFF